MAVLFDFYGTLAHWRDSHRSNYGGVFAAHGYHLPDGVLDAYFARYEGVGHAEHSVDEATYEAWVRTRLRDLTTVCQVRPEDHAAVIDALRASDLGPMVAYPEVAGTMEVLRGAGVRVGVCSNWGWELDGFLRQVGLLDLVDVAVTSARAGARKPHPHMYGHTAAALGVAPAEVVFVGDSWGPDVEGPRRAGMRAVHVWRDAERAGQEPPALVECSYRVGDLRGLLGILELS